MKKIINNSELQKSRCVEWRDFIQEVGSGEKEVVGVRRGKPKAKRGRKPNNKKVELDGGDIVSDSQILSCNLLLERKSSAVEAKGSVDKVIELGFINVAQGEKVWKVFKEWEDRDRVAIDKLEEGKGVGKNISG